MVLDNKTNKIIKVIDTLNQQSKRIKELEEMQKAYKEISYNETLQTFELNNIKSENQQLKQQLHDLPKKIVEEIKIQMGSIEDVLINCGNGKEDALCWFNECLDSILKKYGGEDE